MTSWIKSFENIAYDKHILEVGSAETSYREHQNEDKAAASEAQSDYEDGSERTKDEYNTDNDIGSHLKYYLYCKCTILMIFN